MPQSILITQCLQNDFVKPLGRYETLPNMLHVGYDEARRLMGENPDEGPVAMMMKWAYQQPVEQLTIIHIRDWHDPDDPFQVEHFRQFGAHCIKNTEGAHFAFPEPETTRPVIVVNSPGLSDFIGTRLDKHLTLFADQTVNVGLVGVWTEAKISFLAYDLRTRYPDMRLAICSALTASSSRAHHFMALEQLERLLGVRIYSSIGEFTQFLVGRNYVSTATPSHADRPEIHLESDDKINKIDQNLIRYLFRDCQRVDLKVLDGGFSGNLVLGSESVDLHGHQQVSYVVKIGPQGSIGQEREAFEQIERVLGNNAPRIAEFADFGGRGALKYRYAAMGGGFSSTFQKLYCRGLPPGKIEYYLAAVFREQLGRFYKAATLERTNLLEYYWFKPDLAPHVRKAVETALGQTAEGEILTLANGQKFPNPCLFYESDLAEILPLAAGSSYVSYVHGDLNGANIIIDSHDNVWLIDFFHTHRGHVLRDLIKLENDLLYIFTAVNNLDDLDQAILLIDCLLQVEDLRQPIPDVEATGLHHPEMRRAYETICFLRSFYPLLIHDDRNPLQLLIGQLRYAAHTLTFDESNHWQKLWALYTAGCCSSQITRRLKESGPLRIDWIAQQYTQPGKLGLTILPGRKDYNRSLPDDLAAMQAQSVTHVVPLITEDEFKIYGVDELLDTYQQAGFVVRHQPILDQSVCSSSEMRELMQWINQNLAKDAHIMIHCVGGLGRSGLVAACYLTTQGFSAEEAIKEVRHVRSSRAVESAAQEGFIRDFVSSEILST